MLAGREYGSGSSRDWAAKGPLLLGVRAVLAVSYERIHRTNLLGMGILPLMFESGDTPDSLGLDGSERYAIEGLDAMTPRKRLAVSAEKKDGRKIEFNVLSRLDTDMDLDYYRHGGILPFVMEKILKI